MALMLVKKGMGVGLGQADSCTQGSAGMPSGAVAPGTGPLSGQGRQLVWGGVGLMGDSRCLGYTHHLKFPPLYPDNSCLHRVCCFVSLLCPSRSVVYSLDHVSEN